MWIQEPTRREGKQSHQCIQGEIVSRTKDAEPPAGKLTWVSPDPQAGQAYLWCQWQWYSRQPCPPLISAFPGPGAILSKPRTQTPPAVSSHDAHRSLTLTQHCYSHFTDEGKEAKRCHKVARLLRVRKPGFKAGSVSQLLAVWDLEQNCF